jgi:hypothetical protein
MNSPTASHVQYEKLDYARTRTKLSELVGREVLIELRVGASDGPFRLAARGVLLGTSAHQADLTRRRAEGNDVETFTLDSGGFLTLRQDDFVRGEWHAGADEDESPAQPRLNITFVDSVAHVAVLWRRDRVGAE